MNGTNAFNLEVAADMEVMKLLEKRLDVLQSRAYLRIPPKELTDCNSKYKIITDAICETNAVLNTKSNGDEKLAIINKKLELIKELSKLTSADDVIGKSKESFDSQQFLSYLKQLTEMNPQLGQEPFTEMLQVYDRMAKYMKSLAMLKRMAEKETKRATKISRETARKRHAKKIETMTIEYNDIIMKLSKLLSESDNFVARLETMAEKKVDETAEEKHEETTEKKLEETTEREPEGITDEGHEKTNEERLEETTV